MHFCGPNSHHMLTKSYWDELYKLISGAGFDAIELPCNPFNFELARSGVPVNPYVMASKYGGAGNYLEFINKMGIEEVSNVHISASDVATLMNFTGAPFVLFFEMFKGLARESMEVLKELGGKGLVVSPTPEIGILLDLMGGVGLEECKAQYLPQLVDAINEIAAEAAGQGIQVAVRNEFWSLLRGTGIEELLSRTDPENVLFSPDLAQLTVAQADPVEMTRKYAGRIGFVHFSDTWYVDEYDNYLSRSPEAPTVGAQRVYCDLGDGTVDVPGCYRTLEEVGYEGWVLCGSKGTLNVYRALLKLRWYLDNVVLKSQKREGA